MIFAGESSLWGACKTWNPLSIFNNKTVSHWQIIMLSNTYGTMVRAGMMEKSLVTNSAEFLSYLKKTIKLSKSKK